MLPSTIFPKTAHISLVFCLITAASLSSLAFLTALALTAPQLLFQCLYVLRRTRYHELHLLSRSIHGLSYHARDSDSGITCSLARARFSLRIPTFSNPYFCTVEFIDVRYYGVWTSGCCGSLTARVRLPRLNQTWCRVRIDDMRLTVRNSEHTPDAIARLRENLLRTIVLGEVQRLDHFASATNTRLLWSGEGLGIVAEARGYEVTLSGRMYDFGRLKGSLTRNWDSDSGRFLLAAENVLWYKLGLDDTDGKIGGSVTDILFYPATMISSLSSAVQKPASLLDLEVIRGEIKYRKFRDRDNALERHAMQFIGERKPHWMDTSFLKQLMWGTGREILAGTGQPPAMNSLDNETHGEIELTSHGKE